MQLTSSQLMFCRSLGAVCLITIAVAGVPGVRNGSGWCAWPGPCTHPCTAAGAEMPLTTSGRYARTSSSFPRKNGQESLAIMRGLCHEEKQMDAISESQGVTCYTFAARRNTTSQASPIFFGPRFLGGLKNALKSSDPTSVHADRLARPSQTVVPPSRGCSPSRSASS
jgi:hypothetical protein